MLDDSPSSPLKSAYELALERLDADGIARPDQGSVSDEVRQALAELRRKAEASLAELEILHHKELSEVVDPAERERIAEEYRIDRRRIEERRDSDIARRRRSTGGSETDQP